MKLIVAVRKFCERSDRTSVTAKKNRPHSVLGQGKAHSMLGQGKTHSVLVKVRLTLC